MAEEQKWQEPSYNVLCANNCGFFGSPTTLNLCSKCYKHHCLNQTQISTAKFAVENTLTGQSSSSRAAAPVDAAAVAGTGVLSSVFSNQSVSADLTLPSVSGKSENRNRCGLCRRRVGLTGFECKCGTVFCGVHRYPEKHECSFDFKTVGKEAIARENPVVKAVKLYKI